MSIKGLEYIFLSFAFWVIVEYTTVWNSKPDEWLSLMPWIALQYLAIVMVFHHVLFRKAVEGKKAFGVMVFIMYGFEFIWGNQLLLNIYSFIPASVILISIWGFLSFIPFWIVTKTLTNHKGETVFYCLWPLFGFLISI